MSRGVCHGPMVSHVSAESIVLTQCQTFINQTALEILMFKTLVWSRKDGHKSIKTTVKCWLMTSQHECFSFIFAVSVVGWVEAWCSIRSYGTAMSYKSSWCQSYFSWIRHTTTSFTPAHINEHLIWRHCACRVYSGKVLGLERKHYWECWRARIRTFWIMSCVCSG